MSRRAVVWAALRLGRRRVAGELLRRVFAVMANVSLGRIAVEASNSCPCTGPMNGGYCGSSLCNGSSCYHSGITSCTLTIAYCGSTGCWSCAGKTCCDCVCNGGGSSWYCYCEG